MWTAPRITEDMNLDQLKNIVAMLIKDIDFLINDGNIDSSNIRNISGYNVSSTKMEHVSGIVGMSGAEPANADALRFWAGGKIGDEDDPPKFYVTQSGKLYAANGEFVGAITGSTITGSAINGGTITVDTDVHIGSKLYMNPTSFTADIVFNEYVFMYGDPSTKTLKMSATNGVYVNGKNIVSILNDHESRIKALEDAT